MANVARIEPQSRQQAAARAALEQMYGYYAFDWQPFPHTIAARRAA